MASFDGNGLVIDRLEDIKSEIQDALRVVYGDGINLVETSPWGIIVGIISERYYLLWEIVEAIYQASFPNTSFGVYLDELVALNGIIRDPATSSTVVLTFTRSNGTNDGDVTIPVGTQVTDPNSTTSLVWVTDIEATIPDGSDTTTVGATADTTGPLGALVGTLTNMVAIPTNVLSVNNAADALLGRNEETDSELKARRVIQLGRSGTSTESGIRSALINLDEVQTATLVLNDTDITDGDGRPPHSVESYVAMEAGFQLGQISTLTLSADLVTGNSIQLQINGMDIAASPVAFLTDSATTMELIRAAFEAEVELAEVSLDEGTNSILTLHGSTETAFTASGVVTGGASQPTLTYGPGNAADGSIDIVGQTIWDSKSAGIQTWGRYTATVVDISGGVQSVSLSRIQVTPVYIRYTLTITDDYDSVLGEEGISSAVETYAIAELLPGVDVVIYKLVQVASAVNLPGIVTILAETSLAPGGPFTEDNIPIELFEFSDIPSDHVTFSYIGP